MAKILIIDDVPQIRQMVRRVLEREGFEILEARHGGEGIKLIRIHMPDVVITDILMPEMEGIETIRKLVTEYPTLPVIAITGAADTPYLEIALRLGARYGLHKPLDRDQLVKAIRRCLER